MSAPNSARGVNGVRLTKIETSVYSSIRHLTAQKPVALPHLVSAAMINVEKIKSLPGADKRNVVIRVVSRMTTVGTHEISAIVDAIIIGSRLINVPETSGTCCHIL